LNFPSGTCFRVNKGYRMGLFSRKKSTEADQPRGRSRSSVSSETLASEMRNRARRRLIGALVLVVAAVVIVPMLLNTTPTQNPGTPTVVVPSVPPVPAPSVAAAPDNASSGKVASGGTAASGEAPNNTPLPVPDSSPDNVVAGAPAAATGQTTESRPSQDVKPEESRPKAAEKAERKEFEHKESQHKESERKAATRPVTRTDDGSVAIALLQGRQPPKNTASTQQGNFVLQIAAYTAEKDAIARRAKLLAAGVTDAYIETAVSGGKTTYRLRVGPFQTRDAAQAAQTRLRALGYENGFISSK
jgi:DedD protein